MHAIIALKVKILEEKEQKALKTKDMKVSQK
jgi:hypothetical protein